jgi:Domain of unknown function (DUF4397)
MTMKRLSVLLVSSLLVGFGLLGMCSLATFFDAPKVSASAPQATSPSFVRIIHASPFVGTADVFLDGLQLLSSFGFGTVTGYATIPPGPHKVQIALVGKGIGASALAETLSVSPGVAYTVAAIGTQPSNLSLQVFVDNNFLSSGTAKLRVYELSPDAGPVTVAAGGQTLLSGISYQNVSNYLVIPAGGYTFDVSSPANNATLSTLTALNANMIASLFVVGMFNGSPKSELVTSQTAGLPGVPNTGSDPNAVSQGDAVHGQPLIPWLWPLIIASLLFVGSGFFVRRAITKRGAGNR